MDSANFITRLISCFIIANCTQSGVYFFLDIKFVRENPELVKENIRKKFQDNKLVLVDEVKALDEEYRALRSALASTRMEGFEVTEQTEKDCIRLLSEDISVADLVKEIVSRPKR